MSTSRVSRAESRAHTRAAVLDAAARVFAARGFAGASMEEIATEAGFTRGAVYSNFANKDDLFLAVLDERLEARIEAVTAIMREAPDPQAFLVAMADANRQRSTDELVTWELLRLEFRLYAARNPEVRPKLVEANRRLIAWVASAVQHLFEQAGIEPPLPYDEMGVIVQGLDEGLAILRIVDPKGIRSELFIDTLALLLELVSARPSVASPGSARGRPRRA